MEKVLHEKTVYLVGHSDSPTVRVRCCNVFSSNKSKSFIGMNMCKIQQNSSRGQRGAGNNYTKHQNVEKSISMALRDDKMWDTKQW